jgi:hypothetical protein
LETKLSTYMKTTSVFAFLFVCFGFGNYPNAVRLEYVFKVGDEYTMTQSTKQVLKQTIMGTEQKGENEYAGEMKLKVAQTTNEGAKIEMQFDGPAGPWTDVSRDVRIENGVRMERGIQGNGPKDRVASTGTLSFALDNSRLNLAGIEGRRQPNGEVKIEVDLDAVLPGRALPCAPAGPIVQLARRTGGPTRIEPIEADLDLLWPWDGGWTADHERGAERLSAQPRYRLHMNTTPDDAVEALEALLDGPDGQASRG